LDDELQLVAALSRGDREAFDAIYDRYRPRVFAFLARLSGDRILSEDLLQETFVRLARNARGLDASTSLRPWLFTVARNLFLDHRRRVLLDFDRLRDLALWPSRPRLVEETPFDLAGANETQRRVERALASLPTKYREAVLLVAVEELTPNEAADVLGVRPEALRQRLSRGRALLREMLEES
jgi:RNA polymerase sigma-70 factor (ECF subfamily)